MTEKEQKAIDYFYGGYNCSQSVFAAFHEEMGLDEGLALKLMMPMGGGVGQMREICGAFSGAAMALGMTQRDIRPDDLEAKDRIYTLVKQKGEAFKVRYGTILCRNLLLQNDEELARSGRHSEEKPCAKYVRACVRFVEEELRKG
jgi:C_GCAxxG_C_C family probable redox protein